MNQTTNYSKTLSELLSLFSIEQKSNITITGLCADSRHVKSGDLFIAYTGGESDGRDYIKPAIEKGAAAVFYEASNDFIPSKEISVPLFPISDLQNKISDIASFFYDTPSNNMKIIGITGTNGKTTCACLISHALSYTTQPAAMIGTLGYGTPDDLKKSTHTTPDPITLQKQLAKFKDQSIQTIAMEVSSHALDQHRVDNVRVNTAIFTNLSRDHLDYHGSMENYWATKQQLFQKKSLQHAIINLDDPHGIELTHTLLSKLPVFGYTLEKNHHYPKGIKLIQANNIHFNDKGIQANIISPWGEALLKTSLLGRFNLSNLLAALAALCLLDIPLDEALNCLSKIKRITGRMQVLGGKKLPLVVVDYAHTPDALEKALIALKEHTKDKLWCVFGCGGERDQGKRPMMGSIAERYSDQLILTDDNPRHEDPKTIIEQIIEGLSCPWAVEIEHDRQIAIAHAIDCANTGDIILIAGKGHEQHQHIGDKQLPFNDIEQVQQALEYKTL